jgi:hypothetical protein
MDGLPMDMTEEDVGPSLPFDIMEPLLPRAKGVPELRSVVTTFRYGMRLRYVGVVNRFRKS